MKPVSIRNAAIVLAAGIGLMAPAIYADMHGKGMMGDQKGGAMEMPGMMHDMGDTMKSMSGEMGKGNLSAAQQKQMGERMREMSMMMDKMSGMTGKCPMLDAEQQKQMGEMRKQMDMMKKGMPSK